jgi:hypothetical protein
MVAGDITVSDGAASKIETFQVTGTSVNITDDRDVANQTTNMPRRSD